ncbi:phosphatase PAP2 family protein [bacterium]|nr:MAG: phosphatase PAP2 family protein [bacterium]
MTLTSIPPRTSQAQTPFIAVLLALLIATWFNDHQLWRLFLGADPNDRAAIEAIQRRDWWTFFRCFGYVPLWVFVAAAGESARRSSGRIAPCGWPWIRVLFAATCAGAGAEILKLVIARERPGLTGEHVYRGFLSGFSNGGNLGFASSHAAVAFGAAFALLRIWPRVGVIAFVGALGCGYTRVVVGSHFASDVVGGALIGYAVAALVVRTRDEQRL